MVSMNLLYRSELQGERETASTQQLGTPQEDPAH